VQVESFDNTPLTNGFLTIKLSDVGSTTTTAAVVSVSVDQPARLANACNKVSSTEVDCVLGKFLPGDKFKASIVASTSYGADVTKTTWTGTAAFDEHARDQGNPDPVQEARSAPNDTTYETLANSGLTFVPKGPSRHIQVTSNNSALDFTTPGTSEFYASINDFDDQSLCFFLVPCLKQTTEGLAPAGSSPSKWVLNNIVTSVNASSYNAIHRFNDIQVTSVDPVANTLTVAGKNFARINGVRFTGSALPSPLQAGQDYAVVNGKADGTFQVSTTNNGKPIDLTTAGTPPILVQRIEIIGDDQKLGERVSDPTQTPSQLPAIYTAQVTKTVINTIVWTSENGYVKG